MIGRTFFGNYVAFYFTHIVTARSKVRIQRNGMRENICEFDLAYIFTRFDLMAKCHVGEKAQCKGLQQCHEPFMAR
jgi:hypothetical protein